jgi:hypothetical protein
MPILGIASPLESLAHLGALLAAPSTISYSIAHWLIAYSTHPP